EYSQEIVELPGNAVIVASGGMHGLFGNTTGSLSNTGEVTADSRMYAEKQHHHEDDRTEEQS
ncbi:MAG: hypothetical protein UET83_03025, partial [Eubacteriales bacterium]|nr:hypothetical protein [Eubacteriales bacterium]